MNYWCSDIFGLRIWTWKNLESTGFKIGLPSDTRRNISDFAIMTKLLATNDPSTNYQAKDKPEWEKSMKTEYNSLMQNKT